MLAIIEDEVAHVSGQNHKRHWNHCTNADHAQVTITFVNGKQATFVNSDLAAARKPKFYVLGTTGAIVGDWNPVAEPAVADLPAILTLHREDGTRELIELECGQSNAFHRSIVDYLTKGVAMEVNARQSRDVVAIMQAAEQSALQNGLPITPSMLYT